MIITLKNGCLTAGIDTMGAQLISLKDKEETEYIWQRDPEVWKNCSPILFPIVGNLRNDRTWIEGKEYSIVKHGPCKTLEFDLLASDETEAVFALDDGHFPEGCYPYRFQLRVRYRLGEKGLTASLEVENRDGRDIFYCLGFHTGFRCPLGEGERFEDYELTFPEKQTAGYRRYDLEKLEFDKSREYPFPGKDGIHIPLTRALFANDAFWFDRTAAREVSLKSRVSGRGAKVEYSDFETVAFWTTPGERGTFLCIEPWNGSGACSDEDDEFIHKNHLQRLSQGKTGIYSMTISLL